ncbi:MFS transporter [Streptomyces sp. NPDC097610]|uniref:MFS transporter n=1 Tax=Streptomyces sp. NPDC097610 TaxID=3157227 RepID=UPI00332406DE
MEETRTEPHGLGHYVLVIVLVEIVVETATLALSMVYPALPLMAGALRSTHIAWAITIMMVVSGALYPLGGRLADRLGERRLLAVLVGGFAVGSLICALSGSFALMLVGRALQSSAALLPPVAWALFRAILPPRLVPIAVGAVSTGFGVGLVAGPMLSGVLVDHFGYRGPFWFMFGYAVVAALIAVPLLPATPPRYQGRLDLFGASLLAIGMGALLLAVGEGGTWGWRSAGSLAAFSVSGSALLAFVLVERRVREPLLDLGLLHSPAFGLTMLVVCIGAAPVSIFPYAVPQMLESPAAAGADYAFGLSLLQAGLVTLPQGVTAMAAGPLGGWLARSRSPRVVMVAGLLTAAVSMALLALMHRHLYEYALFGAVEGIGFGFYFSATSNLVIAATPRSSMGVASGMAFTAQSVAGAVYTTVAGTVLARHVLPADTRTVLFTGHGYTLVFWIAGGCSVVAAVAAFLMRHGRQPAGEAAETSPLHGQMPAVRA